MTQEGTGSLGGRPQWTYWVAYRHASGLDAAAVSAAGPLTTPGQLVGLAAQVGRDAGVRDVVVLSWQLLSGPNETALPAVAEVRESAAPAGPVPPTPVPAKPEPVDASASTAPGVDERPEVAALAHVLDAAERAGVSVISVNTRCPRRQLAVAGVAGTAGRVVEVSVHTGGPTGRGTAEDAARLLAEAGHAGEPVATRYPDEQSPFETRTGRVDLPGDVTAEIDIFCDPTSDTAGTGSEPASGGER